MFLSAIGQFTESIFFFHCNQSIVFGFVKLLAFCWGKNKIKVLVNVMIKTKFKYSNSLLVDGGYINLENELGMTADKQNTASKPS